MKNLLSLNSLKKLFSYGERIRPVRDWFVLLGIAAILFVLGVLWEIALFYQLQTQKQVATPTVTQAQADDIQTEITQVQALFQKRAAEEHNYQQLYHFVDPSLPGS